MSRPDWWENHHAHCDNLGEALAEEIQALLDSLKVDVTETPFSMFGTSFLSIECVEEGKSCLINIQLKDVLGK